MPKGIIILRHTEVVAFGVTP
jgi:hypothetical protein